MTTRLGRASRITSVGMALLAGMATRASGQSLDWQPVTVKDRTALNYAVTVGREENLPLFACRAQAGSGVHPGRFRRDFNGCHIGFGGQEISVTPFEVLMAPWQDDADGDIPPNSFEAGRRIEIGPPPHFNLTALYPCRATYQESLQVGELALGDKGCSFGFGGRQVTEAKYQVLWAAPWLNWVAATPHQIPVGAVVAGSEGGESFYVCRATDQTGLHSGKVKQSAPGCSIASVGREYVLTRFLVLAPMFLTGSAGTTAGAALPAGHEKQEPLFLCRIQVKDSVQIGKSSEQSGSCHVGMMGGEIAVRTYDLLSER